MKRRSDISGTRGLNEQHSLISWVLQSSTLKLHTNTFARKPVDAAFLFYFFPFWILAFMIYAWCWLFCLFVCLFFVPVSAQAHLLVKILAWLCLRYSKFFFFRWLSKKVGFDQINSSGFLPSASSKLTLLPKDFLHRPFEPLRCYLLCAPTLAQNHVAELTKKKKKHTGQSHLKIWCRSSY